MATKQNPKSKKFRVAVEGATCDGREISRLFIQQMAATYDPEVRGARVNLEHFKSVLPDSPFKRFGDVLALTAEEIKGGPLNGKLALYAVIDPTDELVSMTTARQKIYSSIEIEPNFAQTGQAYLMGLAVTDDPASLGTQMLQFRAGATGRYALDEGHLYSLGLETAIEFEEESGAGTGIQLFTKVSELLGRFSKKTAADDARFADVGEAVTLLAQNQRDQAGQIAGFAAIPQQVGQVETDLGELRKEFDAFVTQLNSTEAGKPRPVASGGNSGIVTDC
ncbi:Phage capsid scaffolding protein (GPO) serine peptidase [Andreprevotia lacus DSM 23236]|jgi:hypothetical protein|uniref:Phage capsid scaffolding protein (GPO) serine peptidase n=1 Tax=Andreprevotia lacus DSM 23236 TaxID=1121001 RepID=A0A1W1XJK6_9NEIS|nr:GPO family capsid scaffolding protein [Andreprevotia lacus]SMC24163.1 Phage capsid scaffolding protein (GPO) serine peptidase [Andreprevotia lacus DSM 23236]